MGQGNDGECDDADLNRILEAAESLFRKGYNLVADRSLERKMTQQRAQQLSDFAAGNAKKGKDIAFRSFKHESTLTAYFRRMKELLVYYYRVAYRGDGHFTRDSEEQVLPNEVIEPDQEQREAMEDMFEAVRDDGGKPIEGENPRLEHAIRRFYMRLICHHVGSAHFRSPVLSFCAMISRTSAYRATAGTSDRQGSRRNSDYRTDDARNRRNEEAGWHDPGNYSSCLSALVWTAQLVLFEAVCFEHREDERRIPAALGKVCGEFMHQKEETSFGHMLQWRLYLKTVASSAINRKQARWSWDGMDITYLGTTLHMGHISQLIVSEYKRARDILFDELMLGAKDIAPVDPAMLKDDLDAEDYGGSWLTDQRNREYLNGAELALLSQIERGADLRRIFIRDDSDHDDGASDKPSSNRRSAKKVCSRAMAVYEASVQEFLKALVTLMHVSPMPPLRAPEFLTMTYANNGSRRRSMMIWEQMLMVHVCYRKSQEQTDKDGDNVRFIPPAIAELVLTFLAFVQPLRLVFLRQTTPGGLLSPYLFSKLDGTVWPDDAVSKCLSRACTRAQVPEFKVAWWRQAAASITKEKFSPMERANFNMEEIDTPEVIEEEDLIVDLAEGSNHSFRTFNYAYAGSTTLTMNTILHRAFRASHSWRTFFRIDELLAEEAAKQRAKLEISLLHPIPLDAYRKAQHRTRPLLKEKELEQVARRLHNNPKLKFRRPGQRDAILATMGPHAAEQVVVVLATGSGKTLIIMLAAALEGAGTNILVLPTIALRNNMIERLAAIGLKYIVWSPGETRAAPLVIVSAEAVCKMSFLDYAHKLGRKQMLDRIIVDECQLTITASFRKSMQRLGYFVRQVRTQTVWLTATLSPDVESAFTKQNMLLRPRIVRESTNRANIRYSIQRYKGPVGLTKRVIELVRPLEARIRAAGNGDALLHGGERARIIIYCQTIEIMEEVSEALGCPMYTGDHDIMSEDDRNAAIQQWRGHGGSNILAATSAFSVGFDYAHVRWVIHAGPPRRISDLAQEAGRGGRDGMPAESIILLSAAWQPYTSGHAPQDADEDFMLLYLTQEHCFRAVMSQYLDAREDWRWCMKDEDELCGACPSHHTEKRPPHIELKTTPPAEGKDDGVEVDGDDDGAHLLSKGSPGGGGEHMLYTGPETVQRQRMLDEDLHEHFKKDLQTMRGCCLLCRIKDKNRPFDHDPARCKEFRLWQNAKTRVLAACKKEGKKWMADYTACFMCYLPQTICRRPDPPALSAANQNMRCEFPDMVMPICYGAFYAVGSRAIINKYSGRKFRNEAEYMRWLGNATTFAGSACTQAARVAALLLAEL